MTTRLRLVACLCVVVSPFAARAQEPRLVVQSAHSDGVNAVAFSADGRLIATASADQSVKLWHAASGEELHTLVGFNEPVTAVAFSHDGEYVVAASPDHTLRVWNAHSGQFLFNIFQDAGQLRAVAVSPDHKLIAGGGDGATIIFEVKGDKVGPEHRALVSGNYGLAFSPNGKILAAAGKDGTVKLLEAPGGKVLKSLTGHARGVTAVAFSPDGKHLASAGEDGTVRVWKASGGDAVHTLKGHAGKVNTVAFSPDGKTLATGGEDKSIRFWDAETGKARPMRYRDAAGKTHDHLANLPHVVSSVAFGADGQALVSGTRDHAAAALWRIDDDGQTIRRARLLYGITDAVYSVAVAPDGQTIATGMNRTIALWRMGAARQLITIKAHDERVLCVAFSPDGKYLVSGSLDRSIKLWDGHTGKYLHGLTGHSAEITGIVFSPDGKTVASASLDRVVNVWHVRDGKLSQAKKLVMGNPEQYFSVAFSPDGKTLAAGTLGHVRRWDVAAGAPRGQLKGDGARYPGLAFSPDGKTIAGASQVGSVIVWDADSGKVLHRLTTPNTDGQYWFGCMEAVAFHPDGDLLVGGSADRAIYFWDPATGKALVRPPPKPGDRARPLVVGHGQSIKAVAFTADGRFLVSGSGRGLTGHGNGELKLWSIPKAGRVPRLVGTLVASADGKWAVADPRGRYDGSDGGDVRWLHWVSAGEPIALKQLKERYYEPRLLDKLFGLNKEPLHNVKQLHDLKLPPKVAVASVDSKKKQMTLKVTDQGGGVGRVQVFVNNKELVADAGTPKGGGEITLDLSKARTLIGKGDEVRIVTWNADGDLAGRGLTRELDEEEAPKPPAPELYAIVAGISTYTGPRLNLRFAAADAEQTAAALEKAAGRLFGPDKVHVTVLSSSGKKGTQPATKDNFAKAFQAARDKARPGDVFFVFLAGHGLAVAGEREAYCYLTQDASSLNPSDYARPADRAKTTVSSDELVEWIKQVPALKQVMLLDTCASGAAAGAVALPLAERRDVPSGQIRAVERIKDRTGFHVLMGCAADKVSYEASRYEHGLLTYAVLEGMRGPGVELGELHADKLFRFAARRVPQLARGIGGIQEPLVSSPSDEPVVVGKPMPGDVSLKSAGTTISRPLLTNAATGDDNKKLGQPLRLRLKAVAGAGGPKGPTYSDEEDVEDAIRPVGQYTVEGDRIKVRLTLRRNDETVAELPAVEGAAGDPAGLAERIATAVMEAARKP